MLVLRRRAGETIVFAGGVITVAVLAVEGERVKLGITAPDDVTILRGELLTPAPVPPGDGSGSDGPC